jgi:hypothetical protein
VPDIEFMKHKYLLMGRTITGWKFLKNIFGPVTFTRQAAIDKGNYAIAKGACTEFRIYRKRSPQFVVSSKQLNKKKK